MNNAVHADETDTHSGKGNQQTGAQLRQMLGQGLLIEGFLCINVRHLRLDWGKYSRLFVLHHRSIVNRVMDNV